MVTSSFCSGSLCQNDDYVRFCYYTNWAQYRPAPGNYDADDLDAFLCTHIFYAFAVLDDNFHVVPFEWNDEEM